MVIRIRRRPGHLSTVFGNFSMLLCGGGGLKYLPT